MPPTTSAGLLLFRRTTSLEVLLAHMGGPFWAGRHAGAWTVPKGEYTEPESALSAARREFAEEIGWPPPDSREVDLGSVRQASGKTVHVWAVEGDLDPATLRSNTFEMEWPRGSGRLQSFPEIDRAAWFDLTGAAEVIVRAQAAFLDRLVRETGAA